MSLNINAVLKIFLNANQYDEQELLDDPNLDLEKRRRLLLDLDNSNIKLKIYKIFSKDLLAWSKKVISENKTEISILEIGSGAGGLALEVIKAFKNLKVNYYLFDIDPGILKWAKMRCKERGFDVNFHVADSTYLKAFKTNQFDLVISLQALHHIQPEKNLENFFYDVKRISKLGFYLADFERKRFNIFPHVFVGLFLRLNSELFDDGTKSLRRAYDFKQFTKAIGKCTNWKVVLKRYIWNPFIIIMGSQFETTKPIRIE